MKKRLVGLCLALVLLIPPVARANEGMWFLMHIARLNYRDMQKLGLQLTAEEIYSINNSSLKDAVVQFNGGCTAELISRDGLLLTNHHCGYGAIAELSTPENNYLRDGFWAKTRDQELKPKSLFVRFFIRMDDVTQRILSKVNNSMTEEERDRIIREEIAKIERENSEGGKYVVSVRSFYEGNEYYYFVYQDYSDVRLVGTPPESIGKFGGDTDNWEWPRHTGDFSLFRVYAGPDNQPAAYSKANVPFKPKHFFPISLAGIKEGDFAMILGYPGRTNRWLPSAGVQQNVSYAYPAWVEGSKLGMDVMKKYMDKDDAVRLMYATKYSQVANYWKNRQGMIDALTKHRTVATRQKQERIFQRWANKPENRELYGSVMADIQAYYDATNLKARHDNYLMTIFRTATLSIFPVRIKNSIDALLKADAERRNMLKERIFATIDEQYADMYMPLEEDVLAAQLALYSSKSAPYPIAPYIEELRKRTGDNFHPYVANALKASVFSSAERIKAVIELGDIALIEADPIYKISSALFEKYREETPEQKQLEAKYRRAFRLMVDGFRRANPNKAFYPDANSTLRLTYGTVRALPRDPRNDAARNYYTTLKGKIAKYKPGDEEFDLPKRLIDLYNARDFGQYADKAGFMPVNFLTDNDITGGNSGSPVLNAKGELIGCAFDGNIEAMAGDVIFDEKLQRTINVDIRYVLFIIDKFANAGHLLEEMEIRK
ncbi:peptidase S46 [Thermaurantimonas aggregans]|uniref:Dipeptidyl-peptidase n=1 Tax=Thermaurantimonas aggregans TaxID=2173829 RepID=A0A401XMC0_9FLAO|nr:S46 family peptidase [Thermaurantimonas aggregans]MCX8147738.1 S46 family peptidase [Thermaurantimonas aggregans]GCD78142.1 peptidase S46 [Thermaurantimonas aggregans]